MALQFPEQNLDQTGSTNKNVDTAAVNQGRALNVPGVITGSAGPINGGDPWVASNVNSRFFPRFDIDGRRWDQVFPYRLLVIDTSKNNKIVNGFDPSKLRTVVRKGTDSAIVEYVNFGYAWIFELPITPQQLNIQDNYAINTVATLRGVLEEHNGVKFKTISAQGTMGVWTHRASIATPPATPTLSQSVFGGTIEAFGNVVDQVKKTISTATNNHPAPKPISPRPEGGGFPGGLTTTGYYNAMYLQQFLEQYAEAKRHPNNASWRLVFDIPKQNQSFIVTPVQYVWQQSVAKPMEVQYSMQFKAWRRVDLKLKVLRKKASVQPISPGLLQRILNTIFAARKTLSASLDLIRAVRSDVLAPLEALRQTAMFLKDLSGVILTAADLPFQLARDYKSAIENFLKSLSLGNLTGDATTDATVAQTLSDLHISSKLREGLSIDSVASGQIGLKSTQSQSIDPALNVLSNPESNFLLIDQVPLNNLVLTNAQQEAVNNSIEAARTITVDDLKTFRNTIQSLAFQLSNNFGSGDAFVSQIYGLPAPITRITPLTVDDYEILKSLYDVMQAYDILTATTQVDDAQKQTNMDYVAGLAETADITFQTSTSKILVPVPFGLTMEAIAARYLGDPQRWIEIATLNNLRDPYIDEDGFTLKLLSNATGRQITVPNANNLFLGQRVLLRSSTQTPSARAILNIDRLSDTSFLLTLDGPPDLDTFTTVDGSYLQAYLPGTVNSQQKIFIPSDLEVSDDPNIIPPSSTSGDPLTGLSQVDWLLTDSGDIAVNNFGDFRYASGMTNIIQALKVKFGTMQGTVLTHPEFGLGIRPGTVNSTIQIQDLYTSINEMIKQDPRFSEVSNLQIIMIGPTLSISLGVVLAGDQGVFPLTFELTA
jgi:hypothetical protein